MLVVATTRGGPIGDALREAGVAVEVLGIRNPLDATIPLKLAALARRFRPHVIHSHLAVADIASALCPYPCRRLSSVHNPGVELGRAKALLWRAALRRMHHVVAVSAAARAPLVERRLPVVVAHPSLIDPDHPLPTRSEARARMGIDEDVPLVLAVGRLSPIKGFDVLARAKLSTPGARVVVIGDGPERARLERSPLELWGARPDAAELLPAADVVVMPSRSEGFPQVPLHAMAAEVPVVATQVGGTREVVVDGLTGRLVPPEAPLALAAAIDGLLENPDKAKDMGRAGRAHLVESRLTREAMLETHRDLYRG